MDAVSILSWYLHRTCMICFQTTFYPRSKVIMMFIRVLSALWCVSSYAIIQKKLSGLSFSTTFFPRSKLPGYLHVSHNSLVCILSHHLYKSYQRYVLKKKIHPGQMLSLWFFASIADREEHDHTPTTFPQQHHYWILFLSGKLKLCTRLMHSIATNLIYISLRMAWPT